MTPRSSKIGPRASTNSFRVGRVRAYRRGKVWYLCYHEMADAGNVESGRIETMRAARPPKSTPS